MRTLFLLLLAAGLAGAQAVDNIDRKIADMEAQLRTLRLRYTEFHPDVRDLKAALERLREQKDEDPVASLSPRDADIPDNWWRNETMVKLVAVTPGQKQRMDDVFQQYRLRLIDLDAALEKEEVTLEPLVAADTPNPGRITAQIDRVAQARAELEKARGRMLLGIRMVLEPEQWRKLNELSATTDAVSPKRRGVQMPKIPSKQVVTKKAASKVPKKAPLEAKQPE